MCVVQQTDSAGRTVFANYASDLAYFFGGCVPNQVASDGNWYLGDQSKCVKLYGSGADHLT